MSPGGLLGFLQDSVGECKIQLFFLMGLKNPLECQKWNDNCGFVFVLTF